jgi:hypothetical protein
VLLVHFGRTGEPILTSRVSAFINVDVIEIQFMTTLPLSLSGSGYNRNHQDAREARCKSATAPQL